MLLKWCARKSPPWTTPSPHSTPAAWTGRFASSCRRLRAAAWTYGLIGIFGLVLAVVGLAGVTAYSVARRAHEIGIRMALGARQIDVLGLVMKESVLVVVIGTLIGLGAAWAGMRMLAGLFTSVASTSATNPVLILGAPILLAALALMSCYLPARRSTQIDPAITLRQE